MRIEYWKDIPGYEGLYQVSNTGFVRSNGNITHKFQHILKPKNKKGYLWVCLYKNGVKKEHSVSYLVYETFIGPVPKGMQINHIDEDKTNNSLENLNIMNPKNNCNWGTRNTRISKQLINNSFTSKWVIQLSINDEILHFYPSTVQAQKETGISHASIANCCTGRQNRKTAGGYKWVYAI